MTEQKQIEEMAKELCHAPTCEVKKNGGTCYKYCKAYIYAFRAINAGYRRQSENTDEVRNGHWLRYGQDELQCSLCGAVNNNYINNNFCPNCGARMKGDEGK